MLSIILAVLLLIAIGLLIQQRRYRKRTIVLLHSQMMTNSGQQQQIGKLQAKYHRLKRKNETLTISNKVLEARNEAAYTGAAYDREKREEAEKLAAFKDFVIEKHAGHCDTILEEVVNEMLRELRPEKEPADGA